MRYKLSKQISEERINNLKSEMMKRDKHSNSQDQIFVPRKMDLIWQPDHDFQLFQK